MRSYWVCEKSDGVRVLLVVLTNEQTREQLVHIVPALILLSLSRASGSVQLLGRSPQCVPADRRHIFPALGVTKLPSAKYNYRLRACH